MRRASLLAGQVPLHFLVCPDHFHVHIVNAEYQGLLGMTVGQAHLLDDIISLVRGTPSPSPPPLSVSQLELSPDDGPCILARMTLTYGLGDQHGLHEAMRAAQSELDDQV